MINSMFTNVAISGNSPVRTTPLMLVCMP